MHYPATLLLSFSLFTLVLSSDLHAIRETNAQRLARGLPPLKPRRMHSGSAVEGLTHLNQLDFALANSSFQPVNLILRRCLITVPATQPSLAAVK